MSRKELVSVVTVNYNGKHYLEELFNSLTEQTYENFELIMVDNASEDDSVAFVQDNFPDVKLIENKDNLGFAGGNNSAISSCKGEYIAFINNDTRVDKNWLEELVACMQNKKADAVGSKILFFKPFVSLRIHTKTFNPKREGLSGDTRDLGLMLSSDLAFRYVTYKKTTFQENCYLGEQVGDLKFHWVSNNAIIKIPINKDLESFTLDLKAAISDFQKEEKVEIFIGESKIWEGRITSNFSDITIPVNREIILKNLFYIINNAGSTFSEENGTGSDRGFFEDDNGQYDSLEQVDALCGCSFIVEKNTIDKIGLFDNYFFAYYEDTDFFWRLKSKIGTKLFYCPSSIVYHIHTGTSKEWSPFFIYHVERNRLAMLLKNSKIKYFTNLGSYVIS